MSERTLVAAEDRELLAAIAGGDAQAFQKFYRRYSSLVYTMSLRITGQDHDAEDVVADVFWELWQRSSRYCPSKSSPYTYLMMLTRCRALDRKRGQNRQPVHPILDWLSEGDAVTGCCESPEAELLSAELRKLVGQAVSELDVDQRQAIELTFLDGLTHKATAEKLGIPLGTVKGRIRSAIDRLRHVLQACRHD